SHFYKSPFYCLLPPRPLHSFPTRRSSDLTGTPLDAVEAYFKYQFMIEQGMDELPSFKRNAISLSMAGDFISYLIDYYIQNDIPRSEEHTSELQSRFDLVCRLLLEKKKHKQ